MKRRIPDNTWVWYVLVPFFLLTGSCTSSKTVKNRQYDKGWKAIVQSEEWKNSVVANVDSRPAEKRGFYTVATDVEIAGNHDLLGLEFDAVFRKKYHSLVLRAYFKIITQAQKMEGRLKREYESKTLEQEKQKYIAHKNMLEGLRSWNIFNENRTADLDFFKRENIRRVHSMYENDVADDVMIRFLMYRLADLYHK